MKIGVLALQGAFREHRKMLEQCGVDVTEVRRREQLDEIDGLIIPGGESTTIGKLLIEFDIMEHLRAKGKAGFPIFGTCAGLILLAREIEGSDQPRLGLMNITAKRNAYGRQVDSFENDVPMPAIGGPPVRTVFIRAPYITEAGPGAEVLAEHDGKIIFSRQGNLLAAAFHPELTEDTRIHQYFINIVENQLKGSV